MEAIEVLALVSGQVEEELLLRNEYLVVENEILKSKLNKPVRFNDHERIRLAKNRKTNWHQVFLSRNNGTI
jgi:putative transposase